MMRTRQYNINMITVAWSKYSDGTEECGVYVLEMNNAEDDDGDSTLPSLNN